VLKVSLSNNQPYQAIINTALYPSTKLIFVQPG